MNSNEHHRSFRAIRRSIFGAKNEQDGRCESSIVHSDIESFQGLVTDRLNELLADDSDDMLSLAWLQKLLDVFICCQEEFRIILLKSRELVQKPPLDHLVADFSERCLKALDLFNATRDGIERIRVWQNHLDIVVCALESRQRGIGEAQLRRAKKALMDLAITMLDEKHSGSVFAHRNRSFANIPKDLHQHPRQSAHSRSLSWSVSPSWSATRQLQSIANNLMPPRGAEIAASDGLAIHVFTISTVLLFVLWALVAAIPCQDRGMNVHFSIPRQQYTWGSPLISLHDRIMEESKKQEQRKRKGLLKEIVRFDKCVNQLMDMVEIVQFPLTDEHKVEIEKEREELSLVCETFKSGLDPFERKLKEVFHRIMSMRTEGLDLTGRGSE